MKTMRIATTVTGHFTAPVPGGIIYAPINLAVAISEGLAARGHEITFYAPKGSELKGVRVIDGGIVPLEQDGGHELYRKNKKTGAPVTRNLWDQYLLSLLYKDAMDGQYDLLHIHPIMRALPFAHMITNVPTVYSLHDPISDVKKFMYNLFDSPNQFYISASNAQREPAPELRYVDTVYHGINVDEFPFAEKADGGYLLYVGRMHKDKGTHLAIEAAKRAHRKLILVGSGGAGDYWDEFVKPHLSDQVEYVGPLSHEKLVPYYQNADALLMPTQVRESFGLVLAEAMACGTPIIAWNNGSIPEVVADGETGFVVSNLEEMVFAIDRVGNIDRKDCRARVEKLFTSDIMIERYEQTFANIIETFNKNKSL